MTEDMKKKCREKIEREGWHKLGIVEPKPSPLFRNKEVELMYMNMDGVACVCTSLYHCDAFDDYFRAVDGPAKGNKMSNVIAWREKKKPLRDGNPERARS
jgi:hypothetical protein